MQLFIKEARLRAGLSTTELARKSGISKNYISEIESGKKRNVSLTVICKIAYALGVPAQTLYTCERRK